MSLLSVIKFRPAEPQDYHLVLDSWIKTYKSSPYAGSIAANLFHPAQRDTIEQLISRGAKIVCAVADNDRDQVLGWVAYEMSLVGTPVVHYVYVKGAKAPDTKAFVFRGRGLGRALLKQATHGGRFIYTFRTRDGDALARDGMGIHVPQIARREKLEPVRRIEGRP